MDRPKLKPCPFCGNTAIQTYKYGPYGMFGFIKCTICDTQSKSVKLTELEDYDNEADFYWQKAWVIPVFAWNTRAYEEKETKNEP